MNLVSRDTAAEFAKYSGEISTKGFETSFHTVYVAYMVLLFSKAFCSDTQEHARGHWPSRPWQWCPWKRQGLQGWRVSLFWWNRVTAHDGAALLLLQFGMFPQFPQMKSAFHKPTKLLSTALSVRMKLPLESVSDFTFKIKTKHTADQTNPSPFCTSHKGLEVHFKISIPTVPLEKMRKSEFHCVCYLVRLLRTRVSGMD